MRHNNRLVSMKERWGGAPEQWALSKYFKMPIVVYHLQQYNKSKNREIVFDVAKVEVDGKLVRLPGYRTRRK